MKKVAGAIVIVGALLVTGAGVAEKTVEGTAAGLEEDFSLLHVDFMDSYSSTFGASCVAHASDTILSDSVILLADAGSITCPKCDFVFTPYGHKYHSETRKASTAKTGPDVLVRASGAGVIVGVTYEFSTWSDITAVFRPSRWKNPFREGGSLSWLNYKAWGNAPGRTTKILLGEAIVAGAAYAIYDTTQDDEDNGGEDTTTQPTTSSSSSGDTSSSSSSGDTSSGDTSSSSSSGDTSSSSSSGDTSSSSSSGELPF